MVERKSNLTTPVPWTPSPQSLRPEQGVVDVWRIPLDVNEAVLTSLAATLDATERQRADRFRIDSKRAEFIVTRGFLRRILARLLSSHTGSAVAPCDIAFDYAAHGKPSLNDRWRATGIQFNATHSHGLAMIAVTRGCSLGIDIEKLRRHKDLVSLAKRWFSNAEVEELLSLPSNMQASAFFRGWTRKEAFVKAIGDGITYGLDQFDVALSPHVPAALLRIKEDRDVANWRLEHLDPGADYVGAVAVQADRFELRCWDELGLCDAI